MFFFLIVNWCFQENKAKVSNNLPKLQKNEKSLFLGRLFSFLMHLSFIENLVFDDSVVRASASAGAAADT